jgi:ribosomal protein L7/L12
MSAVTKEQVVSFIENMSVIDLSNLVKELETKFGVSAAATVSAGAPGPAAEDRRDQGSPRDHRTRSQGSERPRRRRSENDQRRRCKGRV